MSLIRNFAVHKFNVIGGALSVKLLKRTANFGNGEKPMTLQNQPHNIKLLVPKKSKLFVEQTLREREQCKGKHELVFDVF